LIKWILIVLGILYILNPYDLLPDVLPIRGWIDDAIVLLLVYRQIRSVLRMRAAAAKPAESAAGPERSADSAREQTPCEVLGVAPDATPRQIKEAYHKLAAQYHPDKVAHLGKEFQDLAEKRFKQIQQAYQNLLKTK
jgi:DnaJ-domain-containing protein 1